MTKNYSTEELAQYLDDILDRGLSKDNDNHLVDLATEISSLPHPQLQDDARIRMRATMIEAHNSTSKHSSSSRMISFPGTALMRWVAVFVVFVVMTTNVAIPAMADSLPNDILYPVKQVAESIELSLASSPNNKAQVHVIHAQRRLQEAARLKNSQDLQLIVVKSAIESLNAATDIDPTNGYVKDQIRLFVPPINDLIVSSSNGIDADNDILQEQFERLVLNSDSENNVDEIVPISSPTATLSPTPTMTASVTSTPSPTNTNTATPTMTASVTSTPSPTFTKTITMTPTLTSTSTATAVPAYDPYAGVISAVANVNIRSLPDNTSPILGRLAPGVVVEVIGESIDGQWFKIQTDEVEGWVASTLIVEGTVPLFTIPEDSDSETSLDIEPDIQTSNSDSDNVQSNQESDATNQGNDGINKFDCDGRGNSCNSGSQNNSGNNNKNGGNDKNK